MGFEAPGLLLLAVPVAVLYARFLRPAGGRVLETALAAALPGLVVAALAGPYRAAPTDAVDLVLVVDRSRSMAPESEARIRELIALAERQRAGGRRLGVVTFGARAHVEQLPAAEGAFGPFAKAVDPDASNLAEALETAVNLVGAGRAGKIVVFSDGLYTGRSPLEAASRAAARGVAVEYRLFERPRLNDVAIERLIVPPETDAGAAVQWGAVVRADVDTPVSYRCFRNDVLIAEGKTTLAAGSRPLFFRDRIPAAGGLYRYRLEVRAEGDPVPENNVATAVVRAHDAPRLLLATVHPEEGNLARALRAAGFAVDAVAPERMPRDGAGLDPYRAVALENVPAGELGPDRLAALAAFVEEAGGGLLVTGGKASFGVGGYFASDLDPILPVSMEMRQEHRKFRMAMAIALDRSGSMAMPVAGGLTKMDLANRGAAEAIGMLTPMDEVGVLAVDTAAHVVVPLRRVDDKAGIRSRVLRIQSEGGGIYTYTALLAAGRMLEKSTAATRHIVVFADAADAEEPGRYKELLQRFARAGITVSVIGLGSPTDVDAEFLRDVARRGNGRIFFTERPEDLPRLFAQETLSVARSSFVDEPVGARWMPDLHLLGEPPAAALPEIGGYNLAYARPRAAVGAVTEDEFKAPVLAFWHRALGRAAAFTAEADGPTSGPLLAWEGYGALWATLGRWLMGEEEPPGLSVRLKVDEPEVRVVLELDRGSEAGREVLREPPLLGVIVAAGEARPEPVPFQWTGEGALEARFSMEREGVYLPVVRLAGGRMLKAPPATLPYSPEFLPRRRGEEDGRRVLEEVAARTGGMRREGMNGVFEAPRTPIRERASLRFPLLLAALGLLLLEVAFRRLELWDLPALVRLEGALRAALRRRPSASPAPAAASPAAALPPAPPAAPPPGEAPAPPLESALEAAKRRARRRFE